jgi:Polyketide cyclase / dehydrase and lipid transport
MSDHVDGLRSIGEPAADLTDLFAFTVLGACVNNPAMQRIDDLRDLWNQQTPFAIPKGLEAIDDVRRCFRYASIAGMPVSHYTGMLEVKPNGSGSVVDWRVQFLANHQTDRAVKVLVSRVLSTSLESLKSRFGAVP